jgi:hypothetical protein
LATRRRRRELVIQSAIQQGASDLVIFRKEQVMPKEKDFSQVFQDLKAIMQPLEKDLVLEKDASDTYYLNVHFKREDGYQAAFGGVEVKKNYVSYHLMPVYEYPELLENLSPTLKKRMQGKSCFNFTKVDTETLQELETLTQKGFEAFKKAKLV